jgi:hypothetical protein
MEKAPPVAVDFVSEATLQHFTGVIEALLRVAKRGICLNEFCARSSARIEHRISNLRKSFALVFTMLHTIADARYFGR